MYHQRYEINPNTIKSYKILQKLLPKHAAHGVAQSTYPIYRHGKACLSKQPPGVQMGTGPSPSTRQVPGSSPGPGRCTAHTFFSSLPSSFRFFCTFPTNPAKSVRVIAYDKRNTMVKKPTKILPK